MSRVAMVWMMLASLGAAGARAQEGEEAEPQYQEYWEYAGKLDGKTAIGMTLGFKESRAFGVYYEAADLKDRKLEGTVEGRTIKLDELDASGKVVAKIEGTFSGEDEHGQLDGTWKSLDGSSTHSVSLTSLYSAAGLGKDRYSNAGVDDADALEAAVQSFFKAFRADDRPAVAAALAYPVNVNIGEKTLKLKSAKDLLGSYDEVFTGELRARLMESVPHHMFSRDQGVELDGLWFGPDGKVIAINP